MTEGISVPLENAKPETNERAKKMVLYIGIFSIIMLFAGLSSAYVISSYGEIWVNISMPPAFYISTAFILLSSLTISQAVRASNAGNEPKTNVFFMLTLILGVGFGVSQFYGWEQLTGKGSYMSSHVDNLEGEYGKDYSIEFKGRELVYYEGDYYYSNDELHEKPLTDEISIYANSASSYTYILSALHLLHVLGGFLFLLGIWLVGKLGKSGKINNLRLRLGATYWHFVDGLWIYLFLFLLLFH